MRINPLMNPYFRPQEMGSGQYSVGSGNGAGWMSGLATLPGSEEFYTPGVNAGDSSTDPRIDPDALAAYLQERGLSLNEQGLADSGGQFERWISDAQGQDVGQRERFNLDADKNFMRDAALLIGTGYLGGSALTGTGVFAPAAGAAAGTGAASGGFGATYGTLGADAAAGLVGGGSGGLGASLTAPGAFSAGGGLASGGAAAGFGGASLGGFGGGGMGSSLTDFLTGGGNLSDYARLLQTGVGLYSTNRAADAAQQGQSEANALMREMYTQNRADNQPLLDLRNSTLPQISALMSNPSSITSDPGYQFGLNQGQSQIDNSSAARGGYYSGAQLKASQKYGQDYAGTKLTDSLNRLMGVAGLGQVGATQNQSNNTNYSNMGGNGLMQQGNIRGSGYVGMGNTVNNGIGDWINDWTTRKGPGG